MKISGLGLALAIFASSAASAAEIEVRMLNKGADGERMVFEPAVITANIGDVIRFLPSDKGHNAATVKGAIPDGAQAVNGKINKEVTYEVTTAGVHLFKCTPHLALGMLAVIVAENDLSNVEAVSEARMPKKARERLESYIDEARAAVGS